MTLPSSANLPNFPFPVIAREYDFEFIRLMMQAFAQGEGITPTASLLGVTMPGDLKVSASAGMTVSAAAGRAFVQGDTRSTQGLYFAYVDVAKTTTHAASDPTNPRIDRVVLQISDSDVTGPDDKWQVIRVTGTPTPGATLVNLSGAAAVPATALLLANVLIPAGSTSVTNPNISDQRVLAAKNRIFAKLEAGSAQAIGNNSFVTLTNLSVVLGDNSRITSVANRLTIPETGVYQISASLDWASSGSGQRRIIRINKNGSASRTKTDFPNTGSTHRVSLSYPDLLTAGDYLELVAFHDAGGSLNVNGVADTTIAVHRLV